MTYSRKPEFSKTWTLGRQLTSTAIATIGLLGIGGNCQAQTASFQELPSPTYDARTADYSLQPMTPMAPKVSDAGHVSSDGLNPISPVGFAAPIAIKKTSYKLVSHTWQEFEQTLVNCWLVNPKAELLNDGRQVRLELPSAKEPAFMVINREQSTVEFQGSPKAAEEWQRLVFLIDQQGKPSATHLIKVVELPMVDVNVIESVAKDAGAFVVTTGGQYTGTPKRLQDTQLPNDQDPVQLPQGIQDLKPGAQVITRIQEGRVQIELFPDQNIIVVSGPPEKVQNIKEAIEGLVKKVERAGDKIKRIDLAGGNPQTTADTVQDVYDRSFAGNLGPATISPILDPRGLLVTGRNEAIAKIEEIVKEFDVPDMEEPDRTEFKAFKLKFMSAADAKTRVGEFFGQSTQNNFGGQGVTTPIPVVIIADYRSNSILVKGAASHYLQVEKLLAEIDVDSSEAMNAVQVFYLKNTLASTIGPVLQDAINGQLPNAGRSTVSTTGQQFGGQQQQNFGQQNGSQSQLRSPSLELMTLDRNGNEVRGGIMFDVRVTPNAANNSLVVAGPKASMALIAELITQIDTLPEVETQIKVFQIVNGDAETLFTMLQNLFAAQAQGAGGAGGGFGQAAGGSTTLQLPLQTTSAGPGNSLANLRLSFDQRTNSIIAAGPVGDLQVVDALLTRLDAGEFNTRDTAVVRLSNADVTGVATAVNAWLDSRQSGITETDPTLLNPISQSRRFVIVEPEIVSNSLIISALPEYMEEVVHVVHALDRRPPVLKIKVLMAEVDLTMLEEIGVEMGFQDSLTFDRGIGTIGYPFNQSGLGNNSDALALAGREKLAGQGLSNFATGRINSDLGYGGLVLSAGNESVNLLLRALQDKNCARVLERPHIMTVENQQARIQVGQSVSRVSSVNQTNFGISNGITPVDIGTILQITPRVSQDGMIIMNVDATKSSLGPESQGVPIFVNTNGQVTRSPNINKIEAQTTIMARSGQTVVFSGLIQESKTKTQRGVPGLSRLPLVGPLFRYETELDSRHELIIVLTPYLVDSEEDVEAMNFDEMDRMHWCLNDVAEVYGTTQVDPNPYYQSPKVYYPDVDPMGLSPEVPAGANFNEYPASDGAPPQNEQNNDVPNNPQSRVTPFTKNSNQKLVAANLQSPPTIDKSTVRVDTEIRPVNSESQTDVPKRSQTQEFRNYVPQERSANSSPEVANLGPNTSTPGYIKKPFVNSKANSQ